MLLNGQHIREGLIKVFVWFGNRWIYHSIFWLVLFIALILSHDVAMDKKLGIWIEVINVGFYILLSYFNIFYLVPQYLTGKRLWIYTFVFLATCVIITPLKIITLFFMLYDFTQLQRGLVENQHNYFFSFLLFGLSSTIYSIFSDWKRQEKHQLQLQNQTIESELRFLKTQINPHFLFNTLNSLYALTLKKSENAPEVVLQISEMMRYMLYECNEPQVPLQKEINYIENYLNLEKLRINKTATVHFEVNGTIAQQQIAPLLFIPFIENAFKHGLGTQIKDAFVHIILNIEGEKINLFVKNSKPDKVISMHKLKSGGIGLANVKRRLDLLYPKKNILDISEKPNTYEVTLSLEII